MLRRDLDTRAIVIQTALDKRFFGKGIFGSSGLNSGLFDSSGLDGSLFGGGPSFLVLPLLLFILFILFLIDLFLKTQL